MKARLKSSLAHLVLFALVFAIAGELDFRARPRETRLEFEVDEQLYHRLAPNQAGYIWMAQLTMRSPTITVNALGLRGPLEDPARHEHVVLAVGSSSALGSGVEDHETWTARLQEKLREDGLDAVVLNGASPAWGPYQHAEFLRANAGRMHADVMLVMVSAGDLNFLPMEDEAKKQRFLAEARLRKRILGLSPFLAFSLRKAEVLVRRNLSRTRAYWRSLVRTVNAQAPANAAEADLTAFRQRLEHHERYWRAISDLSSASGVPVVFMVLNPTASERTRTLAGHLSRLVQANPNATVVDLDDRASGAAMHAQPKRWYREALTIPNDGHPNARYHRIMADVVAPAVKAALGARAARAQDRSDSG